jgi:hypothetical protein
MLPVLHLDPVLWPAGLIRPVTVIGDKTFQPKLAGFEEQVRSDLAAFERVDEEGRCLSIMRGDGECTALPLCP